MVQQATCSSSHADDVAEQCIRPNISINTTKYSAQDNSEVDLLDDLIMLVTQQAAGILKVRWAALPETLCLLGFQIQYIQKGPVALWRCPRPCVTGFQTTLPS